MINDLKNNSFLTNFALTLEQEVILHSMQYLITYRDITLENNFSKKALKKQWINEWEYNINSLLKEKDSNCRVIRSEFELKTIIKKEWTISNNKMWYYLCVLECSLFKPYYPLSENKSKTKEYNRLKFNEKENYLYDFIKYQGLIDENFPKKIQTKYKKIISKLTGNKQIVLIGALGLGVIGAAIGAFFAGPIAVAIIGPNGLHGIAAVNAALALLGGGAIAAGGFGIAGGTAVVVGGAALLGAIIGGNITVAGKMLFKTPKLTLSQTARLELVLSEIILGSQQDVRFAQEFIKVFKDQIKALENEINILQNSLNSNKEDLKAMKKSLEYMNKGYKEMVNDLMGY